MSRSLLFVSPHFPPDSAAGTHRARILAPHLEAFGWRPIVLTVDPSSIEGESDPELASTVSQAVEVIRVKAWPHQWTRRAGFGDLGLRAYRPLRREALRLAQSGRVDAVLITTYPTYPALMGRELKRVAGVPFVLDLQDPWVGAWGQDVGPGGVPDLRSRASRAVAAKLEARVMRFADALMSVTSRTMQDVARRIPAAAHLPQLELPIGWDPSDWTRVRTESTPNPVFDPRDGYTHVCAVGTLLPTALDGLRAALEGVARATSTLAARQRLRVWFIGTSNQRSVDGPAIVRPLAERANLGDVVREHPPRLGYFDALRVLRDAEAVLVLGSDEPHYTPSRVFPALASRRPIIARLHDDSPATRLLAAAGDSRPVHYISCSSTAEAQAAGFANALTRVLACSRRPNATDDGPLSPFSGEALARQVANLLDGLHTA